MSDLDRNLEQVLDRLVPRRAERPEWEDVLARPTQGKRSISVVPLAPRRPTTRVRLAVGLGAAAAVIAAALIAAPWRGGPSIIAQANAAIAVPNKVIYEQVDTGLPVGGVPPQQSQFWVESGSGVRHFRAVVRINLPTHPRVLNPQTHPLLWNPQHAIAGSTFHHHNGRRWISIEMGGTLGPEHVQRLFIYQAYSRTLLKYTQAPQGISSNSFDPVSLVRSALANGNAHVVRTTHLGTRRVIEIALDMTGTDNAKGQATYYVDAHTYIPVKLVFRHTSFLTFPYVPAFDEQRSRHGVSITFTAFRYLPATPTNQSLANIKTRHPHAKLVCAQEFGLPDC